MALITEVAPVAIVPNFVLQKKLLTPFREQTGGTVLVSLFVCACASYLSCMSVCILMVYFVRNTGRKASQGQRMGNQYWRRLPSLFQ